MKHCVIAALIVSALPPLSALAVEAHHQPAAAAAAGDAQLTDGEIRKVDKDAK